MSRRQKKRRRRDLDLEDLQEILEDLEEEIEEMREELDQLRKDLVEQQDADEDIEGRLDSLLGALGKIDLAKRLSGGSAD